MATKTVKEAAAPAPQAGNDQSAATAPAGDGPVVLEYKRGKKNKKQGFSKQFRELQTSEGKLAKASAKAARAVAKGAEAYNEARKKSAGKKRDGALRDFGPNLAEGLSESLRQASSIPVDVAEALNTKSSRRLLRNQFRLLSNGFRLWRL